MCVLPILRVPILWCHCYLCVAINLLTMRAEQVVYIIEKKHSRACTGNIRHMTGGNKHQTFFVPSDHRMPRIIVPMAECPQGMCLLIVFTLGKFFFNENLRCLCLQILIVCLVILKSSVMLAGFRERPEDFASALFIARIKDWPEDAAYANGSVIV